MSLNLYFIHSVFKFISLVVVSFISLFGSAEYEESTISLKNSNEAKNINVSSMSIKYNTI